MRVNTDELDRQASALRYLSARLSEIGDTVQHISHVLCRERFGEMFRSPLNAMARSIGGRTDEMNRLSSALSQISEIYARTEREIVDEAEHANVHHEHSQPGLIAFSVLPPWATWTTEPTNPWYLPIVPDPAEDVQVVDGLPTVDDLGWSETIVQAFEELGPEHTGRTPEINEEMQHLLQDAIDSMRGRGYNPPADLPAFEPIHLPDGPPAHTNPDPAGMIDWTPLDI